MNVSTTMPPVSEALINEAQTRFAVGPLYAKAYLEYWERTRKRTFACLDAILAAPQPEPMWFEFAMSSNWRGEQLAALALPQATRSTGRYLDVGCGFGGHLVAMARRGWDVTGIEIDSDRIGFSRASLADQCLFNQVHEDNIVDPGIVSRRGTFDMITCIDVIEHVNDVPAALKNMAAMLTPGGILILEIPNKHDLRFVAHDGHFGLFGITLLDRPAAIEHHAAFFQFSYDVGDYFSLDTYSTILGEHNCTCACIHSPLHSPRTFRQVPIDMVGLVKAYAKFIRHDQGRIPKHIRRKLHCRFAKYTATLLASLPMALIHQHSRRRFLKCFGTSFWTVVARRAIS